MEIIDIECGLLLISGAGKGGRPPPPMVFRVMRNCRGEGNTRNMRMAEAQSQPFDLSTYDYDPSCPLPSMPIERQEIML